MFNKLKKENRQSQLVQIDKRELKRLMYKCYKQGCADMLLNKIIKEKDFMDNIKI